MKNKVLIIIFCFLFLVFSITGCLLIANQSYSNLGEVVDLGNSFYRVTVEERIINITPEEAERRAINNARQKAVEYASGIKVTSRMVNYEAEIDRSELREYFSKIVMIMSQGFIVNQRVIENETIVMNSIPLKRMTLELEVGRQSGERDPYFYIDAKLNKPVFVEGENLVLSFVPSQDCYLNIINIYSNETSALLLPNRYKEDNFALARNVYQVPSDNDGFSFPIYLLPGKEKDTESLLIIATKERFDFTSFNQLSQYNTYESTLTEIMKQLVKIPRNEMEIVFLDYGVYKR